MMVCNTFVRSSLFAALAAAMWVPWALIVGPLIGVWNARALYLCAVTVLYIVTLAPKRRRRIVVAVLAGLAAAFVLLVARTTTELSIELAAILGIARSVFLYRAAPARAVASETALLGGGLLFARFLAGPLLPATTLALWGFLLVQSFYFLIAGVRPRSSVAGGCDPFEEAHRRALALLERTGV